MESKDNNCIGISSCQGEAEAASNLSENTIDSSVEIYCPKSQLPMELDNLFYKKSNYDYHCHGKKSIKVSLIEKLISFSQ